METFLGDFSLPLWATYNISWPKEINNFSTLRPALLYIYYIIWPISTPVGISYTVYTSLYSYYIICPIRTLVDNWVHTQITLTCIFTILYGLSAHMWVSPTQFTLTCIFTTLYGLSAHMWVSPTQFGHMLVHFSHFHTIILISMFHVDVVIRQCFIPVRHPRVDQVGTHCLY